MENITNYVFFSGGAKGADTVWENKLKYYLINPTIIVYRPEHIDWLYSFDDKGPFNTIEEQYKAVVKTLKRHVLPISNYAGKLVRRDMLQVKDADSVFAIAPIDTNGYIKGGTGYATTRAIHMGLNVYTYDETKDSWFKWSYDDNRFVRIEDVPLLTTRSCCVGSRKISEKGILEIDKCVNKLYQYLNE